jgi:hypothetical protein
VLHLSKRALLIVAAILVAGSLTAVATTASATPTKTSRCSGCHSGPGVAVTADLTSVVGTTANYSVSAPTATAIAVFDGTTKLTTILGTSGKFAVPVDKTYTVFAVKGPSTTTGIGTISVSPVAAVDAIAPVTLSDALTSYTGPATIMLTAADNVGITGTFYVLDGGAQQAGTTVQVTAAGAHTLEFWSVDAAGNVETRTSVSFTIADPVPVPDPQPVADVTAPVTTSDAKASYVGTATIALTASDEAGGSGVAATYFALDGGAPVLGTSATTSVVGTHTIAFWSVDTSGNVEAANTADFAVTAVPAMPMAPRRCTIGVGDSTIRRYQRAALRGTISPAKVGAKAALYVKKPGSTRWVRVTIVVATRDNGAGGAKWAYSYRCGLRGTYRYQLRYSGMMSTTLKVYVR